jgi:hypothetical protein
LPRHLRSRLLGDPAGDLGVYVWNIWIFWHELTRHAHLPFSTDHVFGATEPADFSLHNYAPLAGVIGAPLMGMIGVVATFNVALLLSMTSTGVATFALARYLNLGRLASWWAGVLFMAAPVLTAKEVAHFSLVIAAPLPLFLLALLKTLDRRRIRDAVLVGVVTALATYSDAYYGVYCALRGLSVLAFRFLRLQWPERPTSWPQAVAASNAVLGLLAIAIVARALIGPSRLVLGSVVVSVHTWYTPMLLWVAAGAVRAWLAWRPTVRLDARGHLRPCAQLGLIAVASCLIVLLPQLTGLAIRFAGDRQSDAQIFWRTSPDGLDALSYLVPNPSHALFGERTRHWFTPSEPDAFPELVASFSFVALTLVSIAAWRRALPRVWLVFTLLFVTLSLGPFVHVAGVNTFIAGPWAFLRFVPVIGMARSPARFAVVAALGLALLAAFAIEELRQRRMLGRWAIALLGLAAAFELIPAPRQLYSAAIPEIYRHIAVVANADEAGRLLELPTGIRDGASSLGNYSALSSYFQTGHRRPLVGGYLSRVSGSRKRQSARMPMFRALMVLSEGGVLSEGDARSALLAGDAFLRRSCTRFVMVDKRRASQPLRTFAVDSLHLMLVEEDDDHALYTPIDPPACDPPRFQRRWSDLSWLYQPAE